MKPADIILCALYAALLVVAQVALAVLPNIELVSLLIIVFTLVFGRKVLFVIYIFAFLQGVIYGFSFWWFTYLYVWTILAGIAYLFRKVESPLLWGIISGSFGLSFGFLCEIPYVFVIGLGPAIAAFFSGIPFDLMHCFGNFIAAFALAMPLKKVLLKLKRQFYP